MENKIIGIKRLLYFGFILLGILIIFLGLFFIDDTLKGSINNSSEITYI